LCATSAAEESSPSTSNDDQVLAEVTRRIRDLGRAGQLKSAMRALAAMADSGVQPDTRAATALLDACVRNNKLSVAESVFEDLFGEFVEPDDVTFCVMIRGFGECNPPQWAAIKGALYSMKEDFGIRPTTRVYNTILEVCTRQGDLEMAESFVERMRMERVQPDAHTLKTVQNKRSMRALLRRLKDVGPDDVDDADIRQ
ncbi:unnamed protein product, partial [Ostreobium quekettii]